MAPAVDPLAALAELERRYDGPVPDSLRRAAQFGSAELCRLRQAEAQAAFLKALQRRQVQLIRQRRADGGFHPALLDDLQLYRRRWRYWRHRAAALRTALPGEAPAGSTAMAAE